MTLALGDRPRWAADLRSSFLGSTAITMTGDERDLLDKPLDIDNLAVQRKVGSSRGRGRIDNFCQDKGLGFWQEQEHGCQTDSEGGAGAAAVFG